jgi:branched-chain amino acid transport system ATP-binding protein
MTVEAPAPGGAPAGAAGDILVANNITKAFGGLVAVDGVSFAIPRRSIVSIIGPNGAGKTTFFNMLTGLYRPTHGRIFFEGDDITARRPDRIMKMGVARTFQNIRLFATMTALENVLVGQHARTRAGIFRSIVRTPGVIREEREAREKARDTLRYVGIRDDMFDEISINLSYGDQRRLEIARARVRPEAAAARRAHGRDEPARVRAADRVHAQAARRARADDPPDRARHEGRDGRVRADHGARPR